MSSTTSGSSAILVDTNILVYTHDPRDRGKQEQALGLLRTLIAEDRAVISVQCLTEFHNVASRRLSAFLTPDDVRRELELFARSMRVLDLTLEAVLEAARAVVQHQLSLWDSLIWAVATSAGVPTILTEDAAHGRSIEGVRYANPFDGAFRADEL